MNEAIWILITIVIQVSLFFFLGSIGGTGGLVLWRMFISILVYVAAFYLYDYHQKKTEEAFGLALAAGIFSYSAWLVYSLWGR